LELGRDVANEGKEEKGLATYQVDEEQTIVFLPVTPQPVVGNPYPDQTPTRVGERWYQIDNFSVTKSAGTSGIVEVVNLLRTRPAFDAAFETFRYLRFKSVSVRMQNSTLPQIYGYGFANSMVPNIASTPPTYQWRTSWDDTVLLDYSVQNDVTIEIPWRHPDQWFDTNIAADAGNDVHDLYSLYFEMNPVQVLATDSDPAILFIIMAKFNGLEFAGHVSPHDGEVEGQSSFEKLFSQHIPAGFQNIGETVHGWVGRGSNPNDVHREEVEAHMNGNSSSTNGTERPTPAAPPNPDPEDPDIKNNPFGSLVVSPPQHVAGTGTLMCPSRDMTVREIIDKPTLYAYGNVLTSDTMKELFTIFDFNPPEWSRINFMSQFFRMWRGSRRYTIVFFSTPFISARYNIITYWGDASSPATGLIGDQIIQDITVRGTTRVDLTLPFLCGDQWVPTWSQTVSAASYESVFPKVFLQVIAPPVSTGDVLPAIPYVIYESAGSDFEFRSFVNPNPTNNFGLEADGQMRISEFSRQDVSGDGSVKSYPYSTDTEMTIGAITNRWSNRPITYTTDFPSNVCPLYKEGSTLQGTFDYIASMFLFWSGQTKHKILCKTTSAMNCWHTETKTPIVPGAALPCARPEDGMTNVWTDITRVLDATSPFLSSVSFLPVEREDPTGFIGLVSLLSWRSTDPKRYIWGAGLHDENNVSVEAQQHYIGGGEDFSFYFNIPPPVASLWPILYTSSVRNKRKGKDKVKEQRDVAPQSNGSIESILRDIPRIRV